MLLTYMFLATQIESVYCVQVCGKMHINNWDSNYDELHNSCNLCSRDSWT